MRLAEVLGAGVDVAAVEFGLVGKGDGVHQEVELAPAPAELGEHRVHRAAVGNIAGQHDLGASLRRQRLDPLLQGLSLVGEGQRGALRGRRLGNAPGDRAIVGDAHDEAAFALHQRASRTLGLRGRSRHLPISL